MMDKHNFTVHDFTISGLFELAPQISRTTLDILLNNISKDDFFARYAKHQDGNIVGILICSPKDEKTLSFAIYGKNIAEEAVGKMLLSVASKAKEKGFSAFSVETDTTMPLYRYLDDLPGEKENLFFTYTLSTEECKKILAKVKYKLNPENRKPLFPLIDRQSELTEEQLAEYERRSKTERDVPSIEPHETFLSPIITSDNEKRLSMVSMENGVYTGWMILNELENEIYVRRFYIEKEYRKDLHLYLSFVEAIMTIGIESGRPLGWVVYQTARSAFDFYKNNVERLGFQLIKEQYEKLIPFEEMEMSIHET